MYDAKNRLQRMGHKTAPPHFSPLVRCLRTLCTHSGETARWQPAGAVQSVQVESETDTASDSEGTRSDDRLVLWFGCVVCLARGLGRFGFELDRVGLVQPVEDGYSRCR